MPRSSSQLPILACAAFAAMGCSSAPSKPDGEMETVEVDLYGAHLHYMSRTTLTIRGDMPEVRGIAEMTAVMDGGALVKMSMAAAPGRRYRVPQSLLAGIPEVSNDSFRVKHGVTSPPRFVATVVVWIDLGPPSSGRPDCSAEDPAPEASAVALTLAFDAKTHEFVRTDLDECARVIRTLRS